MSPWLGVSRTFEVAAPGCQTAGVGADFAGPTARYYATYRRDVPDVLLDAVVRTAEITPADWVLDLGCGTGQVAAVLASRVAGVLAVDPEPDMLTGLRARLTAEHVENVLPLLASDADVPAISQLSGARFGAVTVANALHWMETDRVFGQSRQLLRPGGALVIISQGPPMWLADTSWATDLRAYLEQWAGRPLTGTCGTDREAAQQRRARMEAHGFGAIDLVEHSYETEVDLTYVAGHLYSAMPQAMVPAERRPEFESGLQRALREDLAEGKLIERIDATALIGVP
jgi:ubiquinone/menaquinone biosynthesis C-methylase UbiE